MQWLDNLLNTIPAVVQAVLLLILALIAAAIARAVVVKILNGTVGKKAAERGDGDKYDVNGIIKLVGSLVFAIVFILFLPGALDKLGMSSVTQPISSMAGTFINFIPKLIACIILVAFGLFLAKLVYQLLDAILTKVGLNKLQERFNMKSAGGMTFSNIVAKFAYVLVALIFVVAAVQVLGISSISSAAQKVLDTTFEFIPLAFAAFVIAAFGIFLGRIIGSLVETVLSGTGVDKFSKEVYQTENEKAMPASKVIGIFCKVLIDIIFIVSAVKILKIEVLTEVGVAVIAYLPKIVVACIIVLAAWAVAAWAARMIINTYPKATGLATVVRVAILVLAGFMALSQLGISSSITDTLFRWMCIGGAAAFAVAFGFGGKDWAKNTLEKLTKNTEDQLKKD